MTTIETEVRKMQFKAGDKYEVLEGARATGFQPGSDDLPAVGEVVTVREYLGTTIDSDGDVRVTREDGSNSWVHPDYLIRWLDVDEVLPEELEEPFFDDQWVPEGLIESVTLDPRRIDAVREATSTLLLTGTPTPEAIVVLAGFLLGEITPREVYA